MRRCLDLAGANFDGPGLLSNVNDLPRDIMSDTLQS